MNEALQVLFRLVRRYPAAAPLVRAWTWDLRRWVAEDGGETHTAPFAGPDGIARLLERITPWTEDTVDQIEERVEAAL